MDFSDADLANDQQLNQAIWQSVKGADIPMPGPHTATPTAPLSPTAVTPGPNARVASGSPAGHRARRRQRGDGRGPEQPRLVVITGPTPTTPAGPPASWPGVLGPRTPREGSSPHPGPALTSVNGPDTPASSRPATAGDAGTPWNWWAARSLRRAAHPRDRSPSPPSAKSPPGAAHFRHAQGWDSAITDAAKEPGSVGTARSRCSTARSGRRIRSPMRGYVVAGTATAAGAFATPTRAGRARTGRVSGDVPASLADQPACAAGDAAPVLVRRGPARFRRTPGRRLSPARYQPNTRRVTVVLRDRAAAPAALRRRVAAIDHHRTTAGLDGARASAVVRAYR